MARRGMRCGMAMAALTTAMLLAVPAPAQILGGDAAACAGGQGPAILANVTGLKDRRGTLKLELYPANEQDFLSKDKQLIRDGKTFRRITVAVPGETARVCVRVPHPGRYALFAGHDRDGKNKFNFWSDGAGFPSNRKLGRAKPKLADSVIDVGGGVTSTNIRMQYLRGLGGFAPLD